MMNLIEVLDNPMEYARNFIKGLNPHERGIGKFDNWDGDNAYRDSVQENGYRNVGQVNVRNNNVYRTYKEATRLMKRAFQGDRLARIFFEDAMRGKGYMREAMSTSDFPLYFADGLDRAVLSAYSEAPHTWNLIAKMGEVADFRLAKRFTIDGGNGLAGNLDAAGNIVPIPELGQYPDTALTEAKYQYSLQKYGRRMPFSWEVFINDDLNAFKDTPARFGMMMRRSEEYFVTKLFANNTAFFNLANKNIVNSAVLTAAPPTAFINPPLTVTGLQQAMLILASQVDSTGQPIYISGYTLVVGPGLEVTANNIINQTQVIMASTLGGDQNVQGFPTQQLQVNNWLAGRFRIAVNYELPIVDTVNGNRGWYIFANPAVGRPAMEIGHLRGHMVPELFMKASNAINISEGMMGPGSGVMPGTSQTNPMDGDFDTDSIHYKVRHIFGGVLMDPKCAVYSNGTNA